MTPQEPPLHDPTPADRSALTGNKGWGVWERLIPEWIGPDEASQKLLQIHQRRYQTASGFVSGKQVLDIACGVGYGSHLFGLSGADHVTGVDISAEAIAYATDRYLLPNLRFIQADAEQFDATDRYDVIVSFETIEHLRHPGEFLRRLHPRLRSGGHLFLSVPLGETRFLDPYHRHAFDLDQVVSLLTATGFVVELFRQDKWTLSLKQLLDWRRVYPEARVPLQTLFLSQQGRQLIGHLIRQGGQLSIPQVLILASKGRGG